LAYLGQLALTLRVRRADTRVDLLCESSCRGDRVARHAAFITRSMMATFK